MSTLDAWSTSDLHAEICRRRGETIDFGRSRLKVDAQLGGGVYQTDACWVDFNDPVYDEVQRLLAPALVVDVGANIGFSSVCFAEHFPQARIVAVEPNPALTPLFHENMRINGIDRYELRIAALGDAAQRLAFSCPPGFAVDGKVALAGDEPIFWAEQTTLSALLADTPADTPAYIKIDAQGYDFRVVQGGQAFFDRAQRYVARVEFAPAWLDRVQPDSAAGFLAYLIERFDVIELDKPTFSRPGLPARFAAPLHPGDVETFVEYARHKSSAGKGYVDLAFKPRHFNLGQG